jgi:hypothetical protein
MSSGKSKKPFGEDDDNEQILEPKVTVKNVGSQKSMFSKPLPSRQAQEQFEEDVKHAVDRSMDYKGRAAELASQFKKMMQDKTLPQNKNVFIQDSEREVLTKMVQLAVDINNDPNEQEGMGSLTWITLLFTTCLSQRDRVNKLEYAMTLLDKKIDSLGVDKKKNSE